MNNVANRQAICDYLMEKAKTDKDIVVLCTDSRGSASMTDFFDTYKEQAIEIGIAEQNIISVSAGLARLSKKPYVASPACFISTRSMEQIKVDVAYSNTNVKIIGISGGISYGALGMTHHSINDIAILSTIPNMRVYLPSDRFQTKKLFSYLLEDNKPAYIRIGRNPVPDIYDENIDFEMDKAITVKSGTDIAIIACGEMVKPSIEASEILQKNNISCSVIDMYSIKPIDEKAVINAIKSAKRKLIVTVEEHYILGGLGSIVNKIALENECKDVLNLGLIDEPVISGKSNEVLDYYGLSAEKIANSIMKKLEG